MPPQLQGMRTSERAFCSVAGIAAVSIVTKLWATSITDNESAVRNIIQAAETSRVKAESVKSTKLIAYAMGLCEAARILMSDSEIERMTGIHVQTYIEQLNTRLCQYSRSKGRKMDHGTK